MAELPFCPTANGSSASPTSVRCRWRISVARRSIEAASSARAAVKAAWRSRGITWVETGSGSSPNRAATMASTRGSTLAKVPTAPEMAQVMTSALPARGAGGRGELGVEARELEAEGGGLGVDAVAAADRGRQLVLERLALQGGQQRVELRQDQVRGAAELDRQRGVEQVGGGQAEMEEPRLLAGHFLDVGEKSDHVVPRDRLDLLHPRRVDQPLAGGLDLDRQPVDGLWRDGADLGHGFGGGQLDVEPDAQSRLGRPDRRHLGPAVARDHAGLTVWPGEGCRTS